MRARTAKEPTKSTARLCPHRVDLDKAFCSRCASEDAAGRDDTRKTARSKSPGAPGSDTVRGARPPEPAALTLTERDDLVVAEAKIERVLASFIEVGAALAEIRDRRLYRGTHGTFEDYCLDRWGFTDRRGRQLIDAAKTGTVVPVSSERQARALAPLRDDPVAMKDALAEASADGAPTAKKVKAAVAKRTGRAEPVEAEVEQLVLFHVAGFDVPEERGERWAFAAHLADKTLTEWLGDLADAACDLH